MKIKNGISWEVTRMVFLRQRLGKVIENIESMIYSASYPIDGYEVSKAKERFTHLSETATLEWSKLGKGHFAAGPKEFYYFKTSIRVPEACEGNTLVYEIRTGKEGEGEGPWDSLNPQFLVYVNGQLRQGFDANHRELLLAESAKAGEVFEIILSAYTGDGNFSMFLESEYKVLERAVEKYYYDVLIPYQVACLLDEESREYIEIVQLLTDSVNMLDLRRKHTKEFYDSLEKAQKFITEEFYSKRCKPDQKEVIACVGHTHIDCAWLWTLKTTEDKAVRSFSTVLELMRQYPEYKFMSSQPQLYDYVKKNSPEVYEEIKKRVAEGRWETEGGMWVEADCNIASGESLIRQFIHGKRFFREEFNKDNEVLWLPDVFGYSAALPQIMKKCGINYFMTTKISWSEFNKMPYDTFMWEGIDGTKILTHFSPTADYVQGPVEGGPGTAHFTTYNSLLNPSQVKGNWKRYTQKELHSDSLMAFGFGDGGGGPTKRMLENCRRMEKGIPGCPTTRQSHSLEFFKKLEKDVEGNRFLPKWVGELYLEFHRGTYTSMARNKRYNRKSEFAYQNLELYSSMAKALLGMQYPKAQLQDAWEVILRNQFHDILPGSSIKEVYDESKKEYDAILEKASEMTNEVLNSLVASIDADKGDVVIFNPNSSEIPSIVCLLEDEVAKIFPDLISNNTNMPYALEENVTDWTCTSYEPINTGIDCDNDDNCEKCARQYLLQKTGDGYIAIVDGIPAKGYKTFKLVQAKAASSLSLSVKVADTPYYHVTLNDAGQFTGIYDKKNQREIIPEGRVANQIITYEDKPHMFDAWDINNYYTEKSWEVNEVSSIEVIEKGPVRGCIRIERPYLDSRIVQYIYFYNELDRIDIRNEIDWNEEQILMRDYFPVDIHANEATFEIQYGNVKRATHNNTSWDYAKFEVCAHKWLDVSEDGYGVSILNDCKFGCSVKDGVIGLSMLKSAIYPNPDADKEHHSFWYSIAPHSGDFKQGRTVDKAYSFNNPLCALVKTNAGGALSNKFSLVTVEEENIVVEVVKEAEASKELVIRMYECFNRRGKVHIHIGIPFKSAKETDMLENNGQELAVADDLITADMKPYEIKTIVVKVC